MRQDRDFLFWLALRLGESNPYKLLRELPYRVYKEWKEYYVNDPDYEHRMGLRTSYAIAMLASFFVDTKKHPLSLYDFMPEQEDATDGETKHNAKRGSSPDAQFNKLMTMAAMQGWNVIDKRDKTK